MKYNRKDEIRRQEIYKKQYTRILCLFLRSHVLLEKKVRALGSYYLANQLTKYNFPSRVKNRCVVTGRGRGVYRQFRVSRIVLKEMVGYGLLPGYHNSSF